MNLFGFRKQNVAPEANASEANSGEEPSMETEALVSGNDEPQPSIELPNSRNELTIEEDESSNSGDEFPVLEDESPAPGEELPNLEVGEVPSEVELPDVAMEPPRALFPGSFLRGEYEIKEIISRGPINYYLADAGDYGAHDFQLVAEREAGGNAIYAGPDAEFFPSATRWLQDGREYAAWDFEPLQSLEEWSAPPNDETYLRVMASVTRGFIGLAGAGAKPDLPLSSLFFDAMSELKCFGFFDVAGAGLPPSSNLSTDFAAEGLEEGVSPALSLTAIQQLSALSSRFAKTNLGARATLRLDDEFGALPFSDEVKVFARALNNRDFSDLDAILAALVGFAGLAKTEIALLSDVGMERELNEDCGLIWKSSRAGHARNFNLELLAVADGMGGHEGGEVASDVTLSALETAISARQNLDFADNSVVLAAMNEMLVEVNDAVVRLTENPPYAAMRAKPGATLVCALRVGSRVFLGNVGDSRAYRWNENGGLERLTKDHSYVQDLLDSGSISEEEAWGHPDGSVITSHIGLLRGFKKDTFLRLLRSGDRLVLVSDGVVDTLRDAEIEAIIAAHQEAESLCAALVSAANGAGGFDNITVAALICAL